MHRNLLKIVNMLLQKHNRWKEVQRNLSSHFRCPKSKDDNLLNEIISSTAMKPVLVVVGGWKSQASTIQIRW